MNTKSKTKLNLLGYATPLLKNQLPTKKEVLLHYFHSKEIFSKNVGFKTIKEQTVDELIKIYKKVPQPTVSRPRIEVKLKELIDSYNNAKKYSNGSQKIKSFTDKIEELFDISACKCEMVEKFSKGKMVCSCHSDSKILEQEYKFIYDQRKNRPRLMYISNQVDNNLTSIYNSKQERRNKYLSYEKSQSVTEQECFTPVTTLSKTRGLKRSYVHDDDVDDDQNEDRSRWKTPIENDPEYKIKPKIESIKLMDSTQAHTSDKKGVSNRSLSEILDNDSKKNE